jgi:hypothetical protein
MRTRTILLLAPLICATHAFAQTRIKPLEEKTTVPVAGAQNMRVVEEQKKPAPPPPPPTNIQSVLLDIQTGDDGKEGHTYVTYYFEDNNKRAAASYSDAPPKSARPQGGIQVVLGSAPNDEYIAGTSISLQIPVQTSIPTGQTMKVGNLTLPVTRYATVADFSNGGELKITLDPTQNGHDDIWKIQTITARVTFQNDPHSPHIIRWSNIVLSSQGSPTRELFFDNNYKPL